MKRGGRDEIPSSTYCSQRKTEMDPIAVELMGTVIGIGIIIILIKLWQIERIIKEIRSSTQK